MDQNWIYILMILVFYQGISSGAGKEIVVQNGKDTDIICKPNGVTTLVIWFRALDKSGMEFIASFSNIGRIRSTSAIFASKFSDSKMSQHKLTLKSFNKDDSGLYTCASLIKGSELLFGEVTRLVEEKSEEAQTTTPMPNLCTTAAPCTCVTSNKRGVTKSSMSCSPIILGALAGGCGLLLLLLIITTVYCNKIRTRRCPHHYKRKPRTTPAGTKMQTNRHC